MNNNLDMLNNELLIKMENENNNNKLICNLKNTLNLKESSLKEKEYQISNTLIN